MCHDIFFHYRQWCTGVGTIIYSVSEMFFDRTELIDVLRNQRLPDGTTEDIGQVLLEWVGDVFLFAYLSLTPF